MVCLHTIWQKLINYAVKIEVNINELSDMPGTIIEGDIIMSRTLPEKKPGTENIALP